MSEFIDLIYMEQIREALWGRGRHLGASVMVGSGFSRNAVCTSPRNAPMPTWKQVSNEMIDALYPSTRGPSSASPSIHSTGSILALGQEFEAAFGREALHSFLRNSIADQDYEPGMLHNNLLSLPWTDVLTTNYDTLLERSAKRIFQRRYEVVTKSDNITSAQRPRIIKLHGSFPNDAPFIFTEEDFRTYPRLFAPFVNLAQQIAMENALCLLGFSGDDPNFLQWSGWVRDHLGKAAPQIYLCGLLSLSDARRKMLNGRNVIPVDLSPLFPREKFTSNDDRHSCAMEWFLNCLAAGEPVSLLDWPKLKPHVQKMSTVLAPPIPTGKSNRENREPDSSKYQNLPVQEAIKSVIHQWRQSRELFPGWLIVPHKNRGGIWSRTKDILESTNIKLDEAWKETPPATKMEFLYELNWRRRRCLQALWTTIVPKMNDALEQINPFPEIQKWNGSKFTPKECNDTGIDWQFLSNAWIELALALLNDARQELDRTLFELWLQRLKPLIGLFPWLKVELIYEECLWKLAEFDNAAVVQLLDSWPESCDDPYWHVRRAGLCAEVGSLKEARRLVSEGLDRIRERLAKDHRSLYWLSREGWAMKLAEDISSTTDLASGRFSQPIASDQARLDYMSAHRCNPDVEWEQLVATLALPIATPKPAVSSKMTFGGSVDRTLHFDRRVNRSRGYVALNFIETVGMPYSIGHIAVAGSAMSRARKHLYGSESFVAIYLMARSRVESEIDEQLDAAWLTKLDNNRISHLRRVAYESITKSLAPLKGAGNSVRSDDLLRPAMTLLARILSRADQIVTPKEFDLIYEIYRLGPHETVRSIDSDFRALLGAILESAPSEMVSEHLLRFALLPIPQAEGFDIEIHRPWPDPLIELVTGTATRNDDSLWSDAIQRLVRLAQSTTKNIRIVAIHRILALLRMKVLIPDEVYQFANALWFERNPVTGLPANSALLDYSYLALPAPSNVDASKLLRIACLRDPAPVLETVSTDAKGREHRSMQLGSGRSRWIEAFVQCASAPNVTENRINWTPSDCMEFVGKIDKWIVDECSQQFIDRYVREPDMFVNPVSDRVRLILNALSEVIAPRLDPDSENAGKVCRMINQFGKTFPIYAALSAIAFLQPGRINDVVDQIGQTIVGNDVEAIRGCLKAIYRWSRNSVVHGWQPPPSVLLLEIGNIVAARRQPALIPSLDYAHAIVRGLSPSLCSKEFIERLLRGMKYLEVEASYQVEDDTTFTANERLALRVECVWLAQTLHEKVGADQNAWLDVANNDPIRHVRYKRQ